MIDLIRFGKISKIHFEDGLVDVTYSDRTDAVSTKVRVLLGEYAMPKEEDPVVVLHLPNGRTEALCLGRYWYADWKPTEGFRGLWRKCFSREQDKCYLKYTDPDEDDGSGNDGTLLFHNEDKTRSEAKSHERESDEEISDKGKSIKIEADTTIEVKAGTTLTLKGDGKVLIQSAVVEISGDAAVNITGGNVNIRGDSGNVRVGTIGLLEHKHNCTAPGSPSGPAIP